MTSLIMKTFVQLLSVFITIFLFSGAKSYAEKISLVIHGGAGTIRKENLPNELEEQYRNTLRDALLAGYAQLQKGEPAHKAVIAAIIVMEDSPLFNAGKGAVFTHEGRNELDASIMDGNTLDAGAISGVTRVKNPIALAGKIMQQSKHVMLSGNGAEQYAKANGITLVDPEYFFVERRWKQLQDQIKAENKAKEKPDYSYTSDYEGKFGTVGAVALDKNGNIAAGTSTGGLTNKHFGRVGGSPIIGAGTYAENGTCGVSSTGHGEFFIRAAVAYDICARVKYSKLSIQQAADTVVKGKLTKMRGKGGIVALGGTGEIAISFNTEGMYRGFIDNEGKVSVAIY